jgi:hypothetical protein
MVTTSSQVVGMTLSTARLVLGDAVCHSGTTMEAPVAPNKIHRCAVKAVWRHKNKRYNNSQKQKQRLASRK